MNIQRRHSLLPTVLIALALVWIAAGPGARADSKAGSQSGSGQPPIAGEALASPSDLIVAPPAAESIVAPVTYVKYKINYWNHALFGRACCPMQDIVLEVQDPCHCMVQVPVCVPGCCTGVPHISTGRDIFGRFSYTYKWRSGYKVDVVFRPLGDVMVHTWSR